MILVIASITAGVLTINATYPTLIRGTNSIVQSSDKLGERMETQVSVVFATAELNSSGTWVDTDGDGKFDVFVWVKNVGNSVIENPQSMDVFLGKTGTYTRIPYVADAGGAYPSWSYSLANGAQWSNTVTAEIDIKYTAALSSSIYQLKVVTPAGSYDQEAFSF